MTGMGRPERTLQIEGIVNAKTLCDEKEVRVAEGMEETKEV